MQWTMHEPFLSTFFLGPDWVQLLLPVPSEYYGTVSGIVPAKTSLLSFCKFCWGWYSRVSCPRAQTTLDYSGPELVSVVGDGPLHAAAAEGYRSLVKLYARGRRYLLLVVVLCADEKRRRPSCCPLTWEACPSQARNLCKALSQRAANLAPHVLHITTLPSMMFRNV
jgi:hypothetical protein